jgi:ribonuclease P protein component
VQHPFRLHRSADFARLRTDGQTWRSPWLTLSAAPNGLLHNRYGFVISKRIGGAVVRNRVRRQLRAVLFQMNTQLRPGYDLVWIARNELAGKPYTQISAAVYELVRRARLLKSDE